MWHKLVIGLLSVIVSQRDSLGKSFAGSVTLDGLKFIRDSLELLYKGELSEEELIEYWRSQGFQIEEARARYERAKAEFLAEQ